MKTKLKWLVCFLFHRRWRFEYDMSCGFRRFVGPPITSCGKCSPKNEKIGIVVDTRDPWTC